MSPAIAISLAAFVMAMAGFAVADPITDSARQKTVTACYKKKGGDVRIAANKRCRSGERKLSWITRGPRGQRGQPGATGASGVQGAPGIAGQAGANGATGPAGATGPSESLEAVNTNSVALTGMDAGTANSVATLSGLPAGSYFVLARLQVNTAATASAQVTCQASLGSKSAIAVTQIGANQNAVDRVPLVISFNATPSGVSSANVKCWREGLAGGAPTVSDTYLEVLKVGSAVSQSVSS